MKKKLDSNFDGITKDMDSKFVATFIPKFMLDVKKIFERS